MLSKICFHQHFISVNKCLGYDKPIPGAVEATIYDVAKSFFDSDAEFVAISYQIIAECKSYNNFVPLCEWVNRRKLTPAIEAQIDDMIESIPSIVGARRDYHGDFIKSNFNEFQKQLAELPEFKRAIIDYERFDTVKFDIRAEMSKIILNNRAKYAQIAKNSFLSLPKG